jgi:hypothetical protein
LFPRGDSANHNLSVLEFLLEFDVVTAPSEGVGRLMNRYELTEIEALRPLPKIAANKLAGEVAFHSWVLERVMLCNSIEDQRAEVTCTLSLLP